LVTLNLKQMTQFKDLEFKELPDDMGIQCRIQFENGYGASIVKHKYSYGGDKGLYEIAVLDSDGEITYTTSVTDDVIGYLRPEDVTDVIEKIEKL
jgi:hypothetical protein